MAVLRPGGADNRAQNLSFSVDDNCLGHSRADVETGQPHIHSYGHCSFQKLNSKSEIRNRHG